jgi:hypothetical protein
MLALRRARDGGALCAPSQGGHGKDDYCQQQEGVHVFHESDSPSLVRLRLKMPSLSATPGLTYSCLSAAIGSTRMARRAGI